MPIIEGYTPVLDIRTAQPPQVNVADVPSTGTQASSAVSPSDPPQTSNRYSDAALERRRRAVQEAATGPARLGALPEPGNIPAQTVNANLGPVIAPPPVNEPPPSSERGTEEILRERIEVAPDIEANEARTRYEQASNGPGQLPEQYRQVFVEA